MPWTQPRTLTDEEAYALTAWVLAQHKIVGDTERGHFRFTALQDLLRLVEDRPFDAAV